MKITDIFIDLDDVLAGFVNRMTEDFDVDYADITSWKCSQTLGLTDDEFNYWLESLPGCWWMNLRKQSWAAELLNFSKWIAPTMIVTARKFSGPAAGAVLPWIKRELGLGKDDFAITGAKHKLAAPGRVLIDDNEDNVDKFTAAGGTGILFPRPWNRQRMHTSMAFASVCSSLTDLMSDGKELLFSGFVKSCSPSISWSDYPEVEITLVPDSEMNVCGLLHAGRVDIYA